MALALAEESLFAVLSHYVCVTMQRQGRCLSHIFEMSLKK